MNVKPINLLMFIGVGGMCAVSLFGVPASGYTFAGEGENYLRQEAGIGVGGRFRLDNYEYTKPILFRLESGREIAYHGKTYDWCCVRPFGGVRQFLYHTDQAIDYGTAQRVDHAAGAAWGEGMLPIKINGLINTAATLHEKKVKAIQLEWRDYLLNARQRLVAAYEELRAWGMDADAVVGPAVGAYRAYVGDRAWKGLNDRNPKKRNLACTALTRRDADLNESIDNLYTPLLAKKSAMLREWELSNPEQARTLAEKRRAEQTDERIRKVERRAAVARAAAWNAAWTAQQEAAAARAAADDAAMQAEEAVWRARNVETKVRNVESGVH